MSDWGDCPQCANPIAFGEDCEWCLRCLDCCDCEEVGPQPEWLARIAEALEVEASDA